MTMLDVLLNAAIKFRECEKAHVDYRGPQGRNEEKANRSLSIARLALLTAARNYADNPGQRFQVTEADAQIHELTEALKIARITIKALHGPLVWDIFEQHSPEMKTIDKALGSCEKLEH